MKRRDFVATAGVGLSVGIAGCSDDDTDDTSDPEEGSMTESNDGPAAFEVELDLPDAVTVDEPIAPSIDVTNTGGESGTFADTLVLEPLEDAGDAGEESPENTYEESFTADVGPGDTESVDLPEIAFELGDDRTFALEETNTRETVTIEPIVKSAGSTVELGDDLRATLTDVTYETGIHYEYTTGGGLYVTREWTGLQMARPEQIYVRFQFDLENTAPSARSVDSDAFEPVNGDRLESFGSYDLSRAEEFDGVPIADLELAAGERSEGWLVALYDRDAIANGPQLGYQRSGAGSGSDPEITWIDEPEGDTLALPAFELLDVDMPEESEIMSDLTYEITVENVGDRAGTFRGLVQSREAGESDWDDWGPIRDDLEPGETATFSVAADQESTETLEYRIAPFGEERTVEFRTAQREVGESFTTPDGRTLTLSDVKEATEYEFESGTDGGTVEAEDGYRFVFVEVQLERPNDSADEEIDSRNTDLLAGDREHSTEGIRNDRMYYEPVEGPKLHGLEVAPQGTGVGYEAYPVAEDVARSELVFRWANSTWEDGSTSVEWTL